MPENSKKTLMFGVRLHFSVKSSWSRNFVYVKSVSPFNLTEFSNVNKAAKLSFFTANQGRSFFRDSLFRHLKTEIELGNGRKINLPELGLKLGRRICSLSNKLKIRCFDWFARLCNFLWKLWPKKSFTCQFFTMLDTQLKTAIIPCYYQKLCTKYRFFSFIAKFFKCFS